MRRVILIIISITLLLISGCSGYDRNFAFSKKEYAYVMNLQNNTVHQISILDSLPETKWAPDNKHILIIDGIVMGKKYEQTLKIYSVDSFAELKISASIRDDRSSKSASWINNHEIAILKYGSPDTFISLNLDTNEVKEISKELYKSYYIGNPDYYAHYHDMTQELRDSIVKQMKCNYRYGILSHDKTMFLYNTQELKTYIFNLKTNKSSYLFDGFISAWSSDEKKIVYTIPKSSISENFDFLGNYDSNQFETYVYDIEKQKSVKCADFRAGYTYFSFDSQWVIFYKEDYEGKHPV